MFETLGETPKAEKCPGIEGIKAEHDAFMSEEDPSQEICDMFLTGAGARTEHYEIAAYSGAITLAKSLGETDAAACSRKTSHRRRRRSPALETIAKRLGSSQKTAA